MSLKASNQALQTVGVNLLQLYCSCSDACIRTTHEIDYLAATCEVKVTHHLYGQSLLTAHTLYTYVATREQKSELVYNQHRCHNTVLINSSTMLSIATSDMYCNVLSGNSLS